MKKAPSQAEKAFVHTKALSNTVLVVVRGGTGTAVAGPVNPPHPNV